MRKEVILISVFFFMWACSPEGDNDNEPDNKTDPVAALLVFPHENSLCHEGTNITQTESTVLFEWQPSNNTDSYTLILTNFSNGNMSSYQTATDEIAIVLNRATPYEWYVISESNNSSVTAQSEGWKFYNAGDGVQNYAPFPAEIVSPLMAETITGSPNEITLDWIGSDVDDDITGFDLYFGTSEDPGLFISDITESELTVAVTPGIYYWRIVTKDTQGNSSDSDVFQFRIE